MKRLMKCVVMCMFAITVLASCNKDKMIEFKGDYTFKTGGYVTLVSVVDSITTFTLTIQPETGQMQILDVEDEGDKDRVLVTMNILGGGAVVFDASVDGDEIMVEPYTRVITLTDNFKTYNAQVTIEGNGRMIDNTIVFNITFSEFSMIDYIPFTLSQSKIEQVAKKN